MNLQKFRMLKRLWILPRNLKKQAKPHLNGGEKSLIHHVIQYVSRILTIISGQSSPKCAGEIFDDPQQFQIKIRSMKVICTDVTPNDFPLSPNNTGEC